MSAEGERITAVLVAAVAISVIGSSFQYGYNIAVVNGPAKLIQESLFHDDHANDPVTTQSTTLQRTVAELNASSPPSEVEAEPITESPSLDELSDYQLFLWAFTVAIYTVGGMVGSYSTGFCVKKLGRKGGLLAINSLSIVGAILMGTSKIAGSLEMVIIARFLLGIFAGLATGIVPLYISEISPRKYRGAIGVMNQLFVTIGILVAQILSLKQVFGTPDLWPVLLAFTGVPSMIQLCVLPFLPESPRCLLIDRNNEPAAKKALIRFRATKDVKDELSEMRLETESEQTSKQMSTIQVIKDKTVRWQLISMVVMQMSQQLCGINAIFFYLNSIFGSAGVEGEDQEYAAVGVGAVNVFMTIISVLLMDRLGRRILLVGGFAISGFFSVLMTISLTLHGTLHWMSWVSIASVIGFIIGFAIGPGPVPWILSAELFRQTTRPAATAISCGVNWTFNFALALVFPFMQKGMGPYVFLFFLAVCIFASTYAFLILPETKHKTFQEINNMFAKRNHVKVNEVEMNEERLHIVITGD